MAETEQEMNQRMAELVLEDRARKEGVGILPQRTPTMAESIADVASSGLRKAGAPLKYMGHVASTFSPLPGGAPLARGLGGAMLTGAEALEGPGSTEGEGGAIQAEGSTLEEQGFTPEPIAQAAPMMDDVPELPSQLGRQAARLKKTNPALSQDLHEISEGTLQARRERTDAEVNRLALEAKNKGVESEAVADIVDEQQRMLDDQMAYREEQAGKVKQLQRFATLPGYGSVEEMESDQKTVDYVDIAEREYSKGNISEQALKRAKLDGAMAAKRQRDAAEMDAGQLEGPAGVVAILGMALGAAGAALTKTPNYAKQIVDGYIQRRIDAQKRTMANRREGVASARTELESMTEFLGSARAGQLGVARLELERLGKSIEQTLLRSDVPIQRAKGKEAMEAVKMQTLEVEEKLMSGEADRVFREWSAREGFRLQSASQELQRQMFNIQQRADRNQAMAEQGQYTLEGYSGSAQGKSSKTWDRAHEVATSGESALANLGEFLKVREEGVKDVESGNLLKAIGSGFNPWSENASLGNSSLARAIADIKMMEKMGANFTPMEKAIITSQIAENVGEIGYVSKRVKETMRVVEEKMWRTMKRYGFTPNEETFNRVHSVSGMTRE